MKSECLADLLPGAHGFFTYNRNDGGDESRLFTEHKLITFTVSNGEYHMTGRTDISDSSTSITSDSEGRIRLAELEPNTYYLKEVTAPVGYQLDSTTKHYFTVSVNAGDTEATVTYGAGIDLLPK